MTRGIVLFASLFIIVSCSDELPYKGPFQVSSGTLEHFDDFPSQYIDARNVEVWLPEGYTEKEGYPVLYMHDGQMLFDSTKTWNGQEWGVDEVLGDLMHKGSMQKTIVVGIWNIARSRHADYFPQKPFLSLPASYRDSLLQAARRNPETALFSSDIQSDNYLRFIVKELKPFIDASYSTKPDQAHTFIAGSSMGGLISMYAICEYPEVFGGAACLSTHWPGIFEVENNPIPDKFIAYLRENLPDPGTHKLYFDFGTETLDALYEPYQNQVDSVMTQKGYDSGNWKTLKFPGEDHSETAWRKRLDIPMVFLLGKEN